jgi:HPr kinase/phosphorylase
VLWHTRFPDGAQVTVEQGAQGEHRVRYAGKALYELSADRRLVRWALDSSDATAQHDATAQRFLLDTVLWWTALARGFELLHASAVQLGDQLVAILGGTGAGKTSLAIELMGRGATLFCDDVLALRRERTGVVAYPGPPVMNVPDASRELTQDWATPIAPFADQHETWMAIDRTARKPASLSTAIVVDRSPRNDLAIRRMPPTPLTLMASAWGLTNIGAPARKSFDIFADLAEHAPAYHLSAGMDVSPAVIAELITSTLQIKSRAD